MNRDKIIFVGDIHGKFATLGYLIDYYSIENAYIIQVGDFGMGFRASNYYKLHAFPRLNTKLKDKNNHLFAIRGNHDDPSYFKEVNNPFDNSNITLLPDYSELEICGKKLLFVGGAVSVDRWTRTPLKNYWEDEAFQLRRDFNFKQYDIVVTHTRPPISGAFLGFDKVQGWIWEDADLKNDLIEEGDLVNVLYELTKPTLWVFGHFHQSLTIQHENTKFKCLDINEFWSEYN
jgi:Icc-related predicted phosphoesterase